MKAAKTMTDSLGRDALRPLFLNHVSLISAMAAEAAAKRGVSPDWELWLATKRALLGE